MLPELKIYLQATLKSMLINSTLYLNKKINSISELLSSKVLEQICLWREVLSWADKISVVKPQIF
jgi:hypothetical protein